MTFLAQPYMSVLITYNSMNVPQGVGFIRSKPLHQNHTVRQRLIIYMISHVTLLSMLPLVNKPLVYDVFTLTPMRHDQLRIWIMTNASTAKMSEGPAANNKETIRIATLKMLTVSRRTWASERRKWFATQTARIWE